MTLMKIIEKSPFLSDFYIWTAVDSGIQLSDSTINSVLEISPSCRLLCISAKYSIENENYEMAEQQLKLAANMIPGRLEPKRLLFKLYLSQNRLREAKEIGESIISMPLKIEGGTSLIVKNEIKRLMYENNIFTSFSDI